METYILDTSAWLTLIEDEAGADVVADLIEQADGGNVAILISFMSFMEVYYITLHNSGEEEARRRVALMEALPVTRVESSESLGIVSAQIKASYHLSVADAWIAALTKRHAAKLIHKDPEFDQLVDLIDTVSLPYKMSG